MLRASKFCVTHKIFSLSNTSKLRYNISTRRNFNLYFTDVCTNELGYLPSCGGGGGGKYDGLEFDRFVVEYGMAGLEDG